MQSVVVRRPKLANIGHFLCCKSRHKVDRVAAAFALCNSLSQVRMEYYLVNVGNIHAVCFADKLFQEKFPHIVDELQHKHNNNVNVEFVKNEDKTIKARVFERGSGETLACGTGATAIARVLNYINNDLTSNYDICFPGGILNVKIDGNKNAELTGESELSYIGEINLADLNSFTRILCQHKNYYSYDKCNNVYKILFNTLLRCMFKSVI